MNINYMMLPFCMTVFLVIAISLLFRKREEGRKEGRKEGRMGGRKNITFELLFHNKKIPV